MLVSKRWQRALVLTIPLVVNVWHVKDYYQADPVFAETVSSSQRIRILTQNVLRSNEQHDKVIELIKQYDPDIVALQEVDQRWMKSLEVLRGAYPFIHHTNHPGNFGIAILSKTGWEAIDVQWFGQDEIPSIHVHFRIDDRHSLEFANTHPLPPVSKVDSESRNGQLLLTAGKLDKSRSRIMVGDFNLTPWSPWFREILKRGELRDAAVGYGVQPTWFAFPTWLGAVMIDHVLVSSDLIVENYQIGDAVGSDHRSVVVDVAFRRE